MIYNELYRKEHLRPNARKASNIYTSVWKTLPSNRSRRKIQYSTGYSNVHRRQVTLQGEANVNLPVYLIKYYTMTMYGEWRYSSTNINILGTKCRLAGNLATQLFCLWSKSPVPINRKLEDTQG